MEVGIYNLIKKGEVSSTSPLPRPIINYAISAKRQVIKFMVIDQAKSMANKSFLFIYFNRLPPASFRLFCCANNDKPFGLTQKRGAE